MLASKSTMNRTPELKLLAVAAPDNGTEVLWCEADGPNTCRIVSVPVFAFGMSVGTLVRAEANHPRRLQLKEVLAPSGGATVRCYVSHGALASSVYKEEILPAMTAAGLAVGPATFLDPDVVAMHIRRRQDLVSVGGELDGIANQGRVRFWELADPSDSHEHEAEDGAPGDPWELVHELPVGGDATAHYD